MTTTKAIMIAITKHETHSYYVIILTFSPVILHCNSPPLLCSENWFVYFLPQSPCGIFKKKNTTTLDMKIEENFFHGVHNKDDVR